MNNLLFSGNFINEQKRYGRVRDAIKEKYNLIENNLKNNNIKIEELNILMIAYKEEAILELYAKNKSDKIYKKICEYNIAEKSGALGPKRKEGDLQVPEGFYNIEIFNPASSYYLSLYHKFPPKIKRCHLQRMNYTFMVPPYFILLILYNEVTRFFFMRCLQFLNISIFTSHTLSKNIYKIYSFPRRYTYYSTLLKKCFLFFHKSIHSFN